MSNILSQNEVDSLLDVISEGKVDVETDVPEEADNVRLFDFNDKPWRGHLRMPALGIINERSVSYIRSNLSAVTRTTVDVTFSGMESVKFGEFCRGLPLPSSLNIFKMSPLRGYALLVFEGRLVFAFVDTFFGGRGTTHVKLEGREFTTIETRIIHKIAKIVLADLERAWTDFYTMQMRHERSEMDPQFASIVAANDLVIAIQFQIDLQNVKGNLSVCLPFSTIEPIREILQTTSKIGDFEADGRWRQYFEKKILDTKVTLACTLGRSEISGRQLQQLKVGDVIPLERRVDEPLEIRVAQVPKFLGYPGANQNKRAIRIERTVKED